MIELRDCIVGVKDEKEYEKVIQIAKEQGCERNSGDSLDYSTVLVNNVEEYIAVTKIAKKQGFRWASWAPLSIVLCEFPTRLEFNRKYETYWGSSRGRCARDYPRYLDIIKGVRRLIMVRKET